MTCRKVISVILSLVIAFSIIAIPASADEIDTITVHYYNENNWSNPYIYYYYGGNTGDSWPGNAMSFEGDGWYSYTIYNYSTAYVIFSDNGSNQNPAQNEQGFQVSDEMWYYKGSWSTERPENVYTTVHYYNENNWSTPFIYYYTDNNNPVSWPGNAMVSEGGNWYTFTIPDLANPKVIFSNNGSNQNPAQNQPGFDVSGEKWYLNGTFYDSEPEGITVHFHNYDNWNNVNIYYYDGERTGNDWTGNPMISDGDGWYTYKIYGFDSVKVLFNNGGNIQIPGQYEPGFDVSGEMWYRNGEWTTERPDEITVFFYKPENWGTPNIYYYKNNNDTGPSWPGEQMTSEGDNWYSFTITKYDEANVLFNSNSSQIPAQNQPGLFASGTMWYKDGVWCNSESDLDSDDIPDYMEMFLGTNPNNSDSDGDGLPDGMEFYVLGTDPLKVDTDENGVNDGAEDADNDGLTNLQEYTLGTNPISLDTDEDGLSDGDEVNVFHTDPLNADTDNDGLSDYDEVQLGLNPLSEDSNNDGILDCDERIQQTISEEIICEDKPAVTGVTVSFAGTGNIETTTTIDNIYNIDMSSSGVVGLIGAPVEINSTSQFDSAVITFSYNETALGDVPETNLSIMWYDEDNDLYIILDQDSVIDTVNNTVSYTTTHFSKYMLVDKQQWYDTWRLSIDYRSGSYNPTYYDFSFVVDTSGSMSGSRIDCAKTALNNFIDSLSSNDHAGLVQFDSSASVVCSMGTSKQGLKSGVSTLSASGGTSVSQGLTAGVNQLMSYNTGNQKVIILICDGDVDNVSSIVDIAYNNSIKIYTVNVVSSNHSELQSIASYTGGEYYYASNSSDLTTQLNNLCGGTLWGIDLSDSDGDGLPDTFERNGMRLSNGRIIYTDPFNPDSDYDGILDGEEMGALSLGSGVHIEGLNFDVIALEDSVYIGDGESLDSIIFFSILCDPNLIDTDNDYYPDINDENSLIAEAMYIYDSAIDDSEFHRGNIIAEKTTDKFTDGTLSLCANIDENEYFAKYSFSRPSGKYATFSLTPDRTSFYRLTNNASDLASVNVSYEKKTLWRSETISVNQEDDGTYLLEGGIEYTIKTYGVNPGGYCFTVEQDNWVYAPYGASCKSISKDFISTQVYENVYISDKTLYEIINHYRQSKFDEPSLSFEEFVNRMDSGTADDSNPFYNTCVQYVEYLNDGQTYGNEALNNAVGIIGDIASVTGVILLFSAAPEWAGGVVTCIGGAVAEYSFTNRIFNYQFNDAKLHFINAMYEGKYNFRINNLEVSTYLGYFNYEQHKSFTSWDTKYYINKISDGVVFNIQPFNIYTATELENRTWRIVT